MTRIDSISNETLMADFAQFDLIRELTTTEGTGTYTVSGSAGGRFRRFSSKYANGERVCCYVRDGTSPLDASAWERFIGVYSNNTITRVTLIDSSTGSWINWGAGTRIIEVGPNPKRTIKAGANIAVTNDNATSEQIVALVDSPAFTGTADITQAVKQTGRIAPTQLTANVNNYAPTGFATCSIVELSCDGTPRNITGLAGGVHGRRVTLLHTSGAAITLKNADNGSSGNNRFEFAQDLTLSVGDGLDIVCLDHSGDLRWYAVRIHSTGGGGGVTDHGALTGLGDDDHTQYAKADGSRWTTTQTASRVVVSDESGNLVVSSITATTLGYLDATSSIQTQLNGKASSTAIVIHEEFIHSSDLTDWSGGPISGGTASHTIGAVAKHPGMVHIASAPMVNSGYYLTHWEQSLVLQGGEQSDCWFKTPGSFTNRTTRIGFLDCTTSSDAIDGAYFEYSGSDALVAKTSNNSTRTTSSTVATLSTDTWYHARIRVSDDASEVVFTIYGEDGSSLGTTTITTNIPTSRNTGSGLVATSSGTTQVTLNYVDALRLTFTKPLARGAA